MAGRGYLGRSEKRWVWCEMLPRNSPEIWVNTERGSAWPQQQPGGQGGEPLLSHSRARSLTRLAVMKCDRGKSNVCIYSLLNYSGLSAEAHRLFSLLMRASLLGAVTVAFANFTHTHTHTHKPHQEGKLSSCQLESKWWQPVLST